MAAPLVMVAPSTNPAVSGGDDSRRFFKVTAAAGVKCNGLLPKTVEVPFGAFLIIEWTLPWTKPAGLQEFATYEEFRAAVNAQV